MTADPNDSKGTQQVPATNVAAILPSDSGQGPAAQLMLTLAQIWADASTHRGKARPAELSDIPPASMRHMAGVLKIYARQLDAAAIPATPTEILPAGEIYADAEKIVSEAVTTTVVDSTNYTDVVAATENTVLDFVPEVMASVPGTFGPPSAYVPDDDQPEEPVHPWTGALVNRDMAVDPWVGVAFGPPAPYVEDELDAAAGSVTFAPKA